MSRSRWALSEAVLALIAILGVLALSGWHHATVHDDDPVHAVSIEHDHGSSRQADPDGPIHVLAHATGQWVSPTGAVPAPRRFAPVKRMWPTGLFRLPGGVEPSGPLRPPRG